MELNLIKFLLLTVDGGVDREPPAVIDCLREENREGDGFLLGAGYLILDRTRSTRRTFVKCCSRPE